MGARAVRVLAASAALLLGLVTTAGAARPHGAATAPGRAAKPARASRAQTLEIDRRIDVNNLNLFITNYGAFGYDLGGNYNGGLFYPNHTSKTAIYAAGLWIGATVRDSIRLAVAEYDQEYRPGRILGPDSADDPGDPDLVVYKVLPFTGNPSDTASAINSSADPDRGEDPFAHHSWSEYVNRAKPFGAPTRIYRLDDTSTPALGDSVDVEGPDVLGDMMLWCVYNDGNVEAHTNEAGATLPLFVQVEQTTWAYNRLGPLGNVVFIKYKITNAGPETLENLFVSQWSDPDLGNFTDDVVGCDTLPDLNNHARSLGFVYNGGGHDDVYGDVPPAVGFDFLQGPINSLGDTLGMTSFAKYINGTDPLAASETYNYMNGRYGDGSPIIDPFGTTTKFMLAGDPFGVRPNSWVDSNPADRRFFLSAGPITMNPGDVQTVIVAIVVGQCGSNLNSIKALTFNDDAAQNAYDVGFDLAKLPPTGPPAPPVTATREHGQVTLTWDTSAESAPLPAGYTFEGYNIYQGGSIAGPWQLVSVYDAVNGIREVFDLKFDETTCETVLLGAVAHGADNGLRTQHVTTQDYVRGTTLKDATDYYFAVTAYAVDQSATANRVLESPLEAVQVTPQRAAAAVTAGQVLAVPNPYYAHSTYEQTQFTRRIRFVNVPPTCTIRIYNLSGQLVRTLQKDDASTSILEWDVKTDHDLPIGSGVYIYHVKTSGQGESVGRLVVFMEKERLNNF